jgi:uncharacterized delta-60 repeat protein
MKRITTRKHTKPIFSIFVLVAVLGLGAIRPAWAADGDLDLTYGTGGRVITDFNGTDRSDGAVLQPDGKVVVAGGFGPVGESGFAVSRYNIDGSLDSTFGSDGYVTTGVGGHIQIAFAIAIQPDGKLLATGNRGDDFATVRYNPDGSLDTSFGSGGIVITVFGGFGGSRGIAIQPDGKIVVSGHAGGPSNEHAAMARYNSDGSLDTTFGSGGMVSSIVGGGHITLMSDGKILTSGIAGVMSAGYDFAVARFNSDGSPDTTFGSNGVASTGIAGGFDQGSKTLLQADGKIVATGGVGAGSSADFGLVRYLPDGTFDTKFWKGGCKYSRLR